VSLTANYPFPWASGTNRVIAGLRESLTYRLAVQVYRDHDPGDGRCARCGFAAPCRPRGHAATVIRAAGDDPRRYDPPPVRGRHLDPER
jgi:hypothetical protein